MQDWAPNTLIGLRRKAICQGGYKAVDEFMLDCDELRSHFRRLAKEMKSTDDSYQTASAADRVHKALKVCIVLSN